MSRPGTCAECTGTRYCAPLRCYCGHEACPAFPSFIDMRAVPVPDTPAPKIPARSSWDAREESTWIDQL